VSYFQLRHGEGSDCSCFPIEGTVDQVFFKGRWPLPPDICAVIVQLNSPSILITLEYMLDHFTRSSFMLLNALNSIVLNVIMKGSRIETPFAGQPFLRIFSRDLRIFSILKILSQSIVLKCQAAWITMRRCVTRRLIQSQAV